MRLDHSTCVCDALRQSPKILLTAPIAGRDALWFSAVHKWKNMIVVIFMAPLLLSQSVAYVLT
jgi:hypothetical protein